MANPTTTAAAPLDLDQLDRAAADLARAYGATGVRAKTLDLLRAGALDRLALLDGAGLAYVVARAVVALGPTNDRTDLTNDLRERCLP